MNKLTLSFIVILAGLFVTGLIAVTWGVSTYNQAAGLKNLYEAKLKANTASFDNMWKTISQSVQVADKQKDALKEIFNSHAAARSQGAQNDQLIMKWVQESVPNVDVSVYRNLQNIITSSRDGWTMRQLELVDIARQYNQSLVQFPTNVFLRIFGFQPIEAKVITSERTEKTFETSQDNDVKLKL